MSKVDWSTEWYNEDCGCTVVVRQRWKRKTAGVYDVMVMSVSLQRDLFCDRSHSELREALPKGKVHGVTFAPEPADGSPPSP